MSSSLYWMPEPCPSWKPLSDELKFKLRELWGGTLKMVLDGQHISTLEGLQAGVDSATLKDEIQSLINVIRLHKSIRIEERW